jgi:hypothetical protein
MSAWMSRLVLVTVALAMRSGDLSAQISNVYYQDDDLLCGDGFSPSSYHLRIWQQSNDAHLAQMELRQASMREAIAAQKARENIAIARRARIEKENLRRLRRIQHRKAEQEARSSNK